MAKEAIVRQDDQGRLAVVGHDGGVVDPAASGEAVLAAARITGDPQLQEGMERMAAYLLHDAPRTNDGILYHILSGPEVWSDATYMAPPFLAVADTPPRPSSRSTASETGYGIPRRSSFPTVGMRLSKPLCAATFGVSAMVGVLPAWRASSAPCPFPWNVRSSSSPGMCKR
jgi:hypothetical protein